MDPVSIIGGVLVGAGGMHAARLLTGKQAPREGLGDILGWAFLIDEGIMLMKDGSFLTGLHVRGRDLESASAREVNRAASAVNDALCMLGEGWALEVNVHRMETCGYPDPERSDFPTPALRALDAERRAQFEKRGEHFTTENTVLLSYAPPKEIARRWERLFVDGGRQGLDYGEILRRFKRTVSEVEALLSMTCNAERLSSAALLTECHRCLTGQHDRVFTPPLPHSYLSYALATTDFLTGFQPIVAGRHVFVVTVTGFGAETVSAAGDFFNALRENARWHMRFVGLSRHEAERRIRKLQTRWFHGRGGLRALFAPEENSTDFEDRDAADMQRETGQALADSASGRARFGYFTNTILLRDEHAQRGFARAQVLLQTLRDQGFACTLETYNATDAFIGSLPGHGSANLRRPLLSSRNVAHLFPTTTPWSGAATCPSSLFPANSPPLLYARAKGATPFRVNLHHHDVGHTLVVGATGAGKSVLVGMLALSFLRYANSRVFVFDVGRSHATATLAAKGQWIDFEQDSEKALQPLRHLDSQVDRLWALSWLETIYDCANAPLDPADRVELGRVLDRMVHSDPDGRTLTTLHLSLPGRLQEVLEPYTVKGAYGRLLDGVSESAPDSRMQSVELSSVLPLGDALVAPLLLALFRQIERSLDGAPTLIVIEEAWAALLRSTFARRMQQWLLTLRKHNAALLVVAHSVSQIQALPNSAILTESCITKIVLPNADAAVEENRAVYRALGFGAREIDIIAQAQRRRDYYFRNPDGSRLFELNLGTVARSLLMPLPNMAVKASASYLKDLMQRHGEAFLDHLPHKTP